MPARRCMAINWPEDRVLVAAITRSSDLRLAREERWYRIPVNRMPQGVPADLLAFFTGARVMGRGRGGVYGFARVTGVELARRRDLLPQEAQRADDLYFRVKLGEWQWRDPPLLNTEGRVFAFIHSTWDRFCRARRLGDLTLRAPGLVARERPFAPAGLAAARAPHCDGRSTALRAATPALLDDDCLAPATAPTWP